jgi:hypothetical protein
MKHIKIPQGYRSHILPNLPSAPTDTKRQQQYNSNQHNNSKSTTVRMFVLEVMNDERSLKNEK